MHLSLALLVLLFSLILSNVINRVFPRLPLPLIQIIFGVGIGLLFKLLLLCCFVKVERVILLVFYATGS